MFRSTKGIAIPFVFLTVIFRLVNWQLKVKVASPLTVMFVSPTLTPFQKAVNTMVPFSSLKFAIPLESLTALYTVSVAASCSLKRYSGDNFTSQVGGLNFNCVPRNREGF